MNFPTNGYPIIRKRRNRRTDFIRDLTSEVNISSEDLILPIFLTRGKNKKQKIDFNIRKRNYAKVIKSQKKRWFFK